MPRPVHALPRALLLLALSLGVAAASAPAPVLPDTALTVTVQPGDTAYSIARRAGISVDTLLTLNGLGTSALKVGQTLRVRELTVYIVQPGETLYALSRRAGVSVDALLYENALPPGAILRAGQTLRIPTRPGGAAITVVVPAPPAVASPGVPARPPTAPAPGPSTPGGVLGSPFLPALPAPDRPNLISPSRLPTLPAGPAALLPPLVPDATAGTVQATDWLSAALSLLGTPYVYGGASRSGTDCSGLVVQVFTPLGVSLPRTSAAQALVGVPVGSGEWQPGDLVFFDTEGQGRVSHVGIYLGDDAFVDANTYQGKVVVDHLLGDRYWSARYVGARRVLPGPLALRP